MTLIPSLLCSHMLLLPYLLAPNTASTTSRKTAKKGQGQGQAPRPLVVSSTWAFLQARDAAEHVSAVGCSPLPAPCSQLQNKRDNDMRVNSFIGFAGTGGQGRRGLTDEAGTSELLSTRSLLAVATNILRRTWTALGHVRCEFE